MISDESDTALSAVRTPALELALEQSHGVKAKVEEIADTLADTNLGVEEKIAAGATTISARNALKDNQAHEAKVVECAADLSDVTETLAHGISDLRETVDQLTQAQAALVTTQAALAAAHAASNATDRSRGPSVSVPKWRWQKRIATCYKPCVTSAWHHWRC